MGSRLRTAAVAAIAAAGLVSMSGAALAAPAQAGTTGRTMRSCATPTAGHAHCLAEMRTDVHRSNAAVRRAAATPSGYGPADLQSAYNLPSASAGSGQTVAIVDAYDAPTAEQDLAVYRSQYGLPACTTANGCFRKVDQNGGTRYPHKNGGWAQEISLDLDMVSAVCPNCNILLVEAKTASFANLGAAVDRAATMGADVISNSYGGSDASDANYGQYYNHPGVAITVSSGDAGYGVEYPASSHYVTAVGGTSLRQDSSSRGWSESVWSGAGSGCSSYNAALSGQSGVGTGCGNRAVADVSAVADPNTGVAVYDSTAYQGYSGWMVFGGTSVAAPVIGAVYGLAGNAGSIDNNYPYAHASSLFDVTSGSNGSCSTSQWCTARSGWDGPTGLGTPNGTGAF
ncbi:peptidase S8 [Actinocatenispora thailandica]|uniref:Peptidase S8 n=1 Tax=Actinocatenispora thailandica TaxID=227318 RepID=A0A7R7DLW7_9ACTN|nr:S53 family peptidase [Actinocatenispora thailandica]BCJ34120.1 peptidase S8 [Actinocatenispora thailandica]